MPSEREAQDLQVHIIQSLMVQSNPQLKVIKVKDMSDEFVKTAPDYIAYQVDDVEGGGGHFHEVGTARNHKDGEGLTVRLKSLPVSGEVVLRAYKPKEGTAEEAETSA